MKNLIKSTATLLSLLLILSACFASKERVINLSLTHPDDGGPTFDIKKYINGDLEGWGYFEDAKGNITKRVTAKVKGSWDGNKGIIKRGFVIDGEKTGARTWLITMDEDDFSAIGHEVIGSAKGQQYKGLSQMFYKVKMKFDGPKIETDVTETTYNINNKSSMSVFEYKSGKQIVGKMILSLRKVSSKKPRKTTIQNDLPKTLSKKPSTQNEENKE
jgi:hypothetical protein